MITTRPTMITPLRSRNSQRHTPQGANSITESGPDPFLACRWQSRRSRNAH